MFCGETALHNVYRRNAVMSIPSHRIAGREIPPQTTAATSRDPLEQNYRRRHLHLLSASSMHVKLYHFPLLRTLHYVFMAARKFTLVSRWRGVVIHLEGGFTLGLWIFQNTIPPLFLHSFFLASLFVQVSVLCASWCLLSFRERERGRSKDTKILLYYAVDGC
jgi:hypothetical protein